MNYNKQGSGKFIVAIFLITCCIILLLVQVKENGDNISNLKSELHTYEREVEETTKVTQIRYSYEIPIEYDLPDVSPSKAYKVYEVDRPELHEKKIYTCYTAVTDTSSKQHKLLNSGEVLTDESGVRVVKDSNGVYRYCVAVGQYWSTQIGQLIDFHMANGAVLPCVVCDLKQDRHTINQAGKYGYQANDLIEFYVNPYALTVVDYYTGEWGKQIPLYYPAGDVSSAKEEFEGAVLYVVVWDEWISGFEPDSNGWKSLLN